MDFREKLVQKVSRVSKDPRVNKAKLAKKESKVLEDYEVQLDIQVNEA